MTSAKSARQHKVTAFEYLKELPRDWLPFNGERMKASSNSDLWRWLNMGAIIINGEKPKPKDEIKFPVWQLTFFPNGKRRTTIIC